MHEVREGLCRMGWSPIRGFNRLWPSHCEPFFFFKLTMHYTGFSHVLQIPNAATEACLACGHGWIGHFGSEVPPPSSSAFHFLKGVCGTDCGGYWSVSIVLHPHYRWTAPHILLSPVQFGTPVVYALVPCHGHRICRSRTPPQRHPLDKLPVSHPAQVRQATRLAVSAAVNPPNTFLLIVSNEHRSRAAHQRIQRAAWTAVTIPKQR